MAGVQPINADSRPMTSFDSVAIAKIAIFSVYLLVAVYLCFKHGWKLSDGWIYIAILSIANLLGSIFLLATINDPSNKSLITGGTVLSSVGLGMLILVLLGLLERIFSSINHNSPVAVKPIYRRTIDTLMLVALILSVVGGTQTERKEGSINYSGTSDASMGVMIAVVALLCCEVYYLVKQMGLVPEGERRTLFTIIASLPFVIVRLAYSCTLIFGDRIETFGIYLGTSVIPEVMVVLICEVAGFLLPKQSLPHKQLSDGELEGQRS